MQTIEIVGGNLFRVAAVYLNDATQWIRIAQLNAIRDPWQPGTTTLRIPDRNPAAGGGVAAQ